MTDTAHDLRIARAERDAYADTCEELHRTIAGLTVEIETHMGHREAADQRTRSLDAALAAEREASKGLVAQVEALRAERDRTLKEYGRSVASLRPSVEDMAAQLSAIRDLVAPGNPQGTVVDAVRADKAGAWERIKAENKRACDAEQAVRNMEIDRDAAIARAEKAERAADWMTAMHADEADAANKLRAEVAELRARPVLDVDDIEARCMADFMGGHHGDAYEAFKHGMVTVCNVLRSHPVTLPTPDAAQVLVDKMQSYGWWCASDSGDGRCAADMKRAITALAKLAPPAPAKVEAPAEFTAADVDELAVSFLRISHHDQYASLKSLDDRDRAAIRAVLAAARLHVVDAEGLHGAMHGLGAAVSLSTCREAIKRATARKGG